MHAHWNRNFDSDIAFHRRTEAHSSQRNTHVSHTNQPQKNIYHVLWRFFDLELEFIHHGDRIHALSNRYIMPVSETDAVPRTQSMLSCYPLKVQKCAIASFLSCDVPVATLLQSRHVGLRWFPRWVKDAWGSQCSYSNKHDALNVEKNSGSAQRERERERERKKDRETEREREREREREKERKKI